MVTKFDVIGIFIKRRKQRPYVKTQGEDDRLQGKERPQMKPTCFDLRLLSTEL